MLEKSWQRRAPVLQETRKKMPRFCREKGNAFSDVYMVSKLFEKACDQVIPFLGIDPGSDSDSYSFLNIGDFKLFNCTSCWFQFVVLLSAVTAAFIFGIYLRRQTIVGLLRQKEEWVDREKMLLNQLWAALEEKLELKSMWQESKTALDQTKAELNAERSEKDTIQTKLWGMERNIKTMQSERDTMADRLKDCIGTFGGLRTSLGKHCGQGENPEIAKCMEKVKSLQGLMQKLIEAHRHERKNFVSILERQSCC